MDFVIPLWGKFGGFGILLGSVLWVFYAVLNGKLITGKEQDRRNAEHEEALVAERVKAKEDLDRAEERSRQWQDAWQASQSLAAQQADSVARLTTVAEVMEAFLKALQKVVPLPVEPGDDES